MPRQRVIGDHQLNVKVLAWVLGTCAIDASTKWWARAQFSGAGHHVLGPLWLRVSYNRGVSFSLTMAGSVLTAVLILALVVVVAVFALRAAPGISTWGFGLLLGGGLSNELERLLRSSHAVTDFISVGWFPVFNLADTAITLGFVCLFVAMLRGEKLVRR